MRNGRVVALIFALALLAGVARGGPYERLDVETSKTSIYVGSVTLAMSPFKRERASFVADYRATVFPYFFYNETGRVWIDLADADLERLAKGETVEFTGRAENTDKKPRTISGRAAPSGANQGKIKVRIGSKSPKVELIFNTTYRFGGQ
jgi:hypothetical protein